MNFTYLATLIGLNLETYVFGTPELLGIFGVIFLLFICWRLGLSFDGALVIVSFGVISLTGSFLLPGGELIKMLIFIGILGGIGFVWFSRFFRT